MTSSRTDLVGEVAERLGVRVLRTMGRGGSGASSLLTESGAGELAVLKIVAARPDAVDGHDLESFRQKARQVEHLRQSCPAVARHYPPLLAALDDPGWSATLTSYVPGVDLVALAARDGDGAAHAALRGVWRRLSADGYAATSQPASAEHWLQDFCDRLDRRRPLLADHVPAVLLGADAVIINGRTVAGLAGAAATARGLGWVFDDSRVAAPVHGDLNLRNIVIGDRGDGGPAFALLDPRGTTSRWDPVYDLAKVLFTLTVFDDLMEGGARIGQRSGSEFTVSLRARSHQAWLARLLPDLEQLLDEAGVTGELALPQLLLAHATHLLAESACRISDIGQHPDARRESAVALLLLGLLLVDDLAETIGGGRPLSVSDHLAALENPGPRRQTGGAPATRTGPAVPDYRLIRHIPTMAGCSVDVGVTPDGQQVIVKRALGPAAASALDAYVRQLRRLRQLEEVAGYYPPVLEHADGTAVFPYYSRGSLDAAGAGERSSFRRLVSEAVDAVFAISGHRRFPVEPSGPAPLEAARAFWRLQFSHRLDRLDQAGVDRSRPPFRDLSRALDDGLLDRLIARAVSRPLGLAAHGDLSLSNVLLADPGEAGPAFRFIDLRARDGWAGGLPWWDPVLDLATLITFHGLIEPALGVRDGIALGPDHGLAVFTRDEILADAVAQPSVRRWLAGDPAWQLRTQLGIVARLLGSVSTQLLAAPKDRRSRADRVTGLLSREWEALLSC